MALLQDILTLTALDAKSAAIGIAVFLIFVFAIREFHSWYRLSHIPGPFWHSVSSIPISRVFASTRASFWMSDAIQKYVNGVRSNFYKGDMYIAGKFTEPDTVFSTRDDEYRRGMKAKLTPGVSSLDVTVPNVPIHIPMLSAMLRTVHELTAQYTGHYTPIEPKIDTTIASLIALINTKYLTTPSSSPTLDLAQKTMFFTLDTISSLAWDSPLGFLATDTDVYNLVSINDTSLVATTYRLVPFTWVFKLLQTWPLEHLPITPKEGDRVGFGRLLTAATECVERRLKEGGNEKGMIMTHFIGETK
ncbi:hypothetical protein OQA88_3450 [Cercophora sp. LCS_1]